MDLERLHAWLAAALAALTGSTGFYIYSIGFWAAVLASLVGVWQTIPSVAADCYSLLVRMPPDQRKAATQPGARPYRARCCSWRLRPCPSPSSAGRCSSSSHSPSSAASSFRSSPATLLYLNNRVAFPAPLHPNRLATNVVLGLILVVGGLEIAALVAR